jgi:hypothetical protein
MNALVATTIRITEHMKFNDDVVNTSIEYLKRFFLKQSFYDFEGLEMMYAAIYLAVKVEEVSFLLGEFARVNKSCTVEKIVQNETYLIKGMKFQFLVYSPYRCFNGFFAIFKNKIDKLGIEEYEEKLKEIEETAHKALRKLHFTDASFLHPPSLIAFSVLAFAYK